MYLRYKLIGGNEYFEVDNESDMIDLFVSTVMGYTFPQPVETPIEVDSVNTTAWVKKYTFGS
jgi:hypothetical protein